MSTNSSKLFSCSGGAENDDPQTDAQFGVSFVPCLARCGSIIHQVVNKYVVLQKTFFDNPVFGRLHRYLFRPASDNPYFALEPEEVDVEDDL
jgi:hypothetical protein